MSYLNKNYKILFQCIISVQLSSEIVYILVYITDMWHASQITIQPHFNAQQPCVAGLQHTEEHRSNENTDTAIVEMYLLRQTKLYAIPRN